LLKNPGGGMKKEKGWNDATDAACSGFLPAQE